jgi:hypothetical protein
MRDGQSFSYEAESSVPEEFAAYARRERQPLACCA